MNKSTESVEHTLDSAFVLHTRPYRNTSLLVEFFTQQRGRVTAIARGIRTRRPGGRSNLLQPFSPLLIKLNGRRGLSYLQDVESAAPAFSLQGKNLYSGFYLNELVMRLLPSADAAPKSFDDYHQALVDLNAGAHVEAALRKFELRFLEALGYDIPLNQEIKTGLALNTDSYYRFHPQQGFRLCQPDDDGLLMLGRHLIAIAKEDFSDKATRQTAKYLMRLALSPLLGDTPLQSRKLFKRKVSHE